MAVISEEALKFWIFLLATLVAFFVILIFINRNFPIDQILPIVKG